MTNEAIWMAIDCLAAIHGMSCSRLAQISGLDTTAFNRSKRYTRGGKPRWPSFGSVAKVLKATNTTWAEFVSLIPPESNETSCENK